MKKFLILLALTFPAFGQDISPAVSLGGSAGITGGQSLTGQNILTHMTDANYTMVASGWWAGTQIVPSSLTLTANRTVTPPANAGQNYNFCNYSTGGFSIIINSVTIANGTCQMIANPLGNGYIATTSAGNITATPMGNQYVMQPNGTTLGVNSLNNVLYVNPASSTDLVTQVNALIPSTCPAQGLLIMIPPGTYNVTSGTITNTCPTISIKGSGIGSTVINYAGTNFLTVMSLNSSGNFTILPSGTIGDFTLNCTNASVICLSIRSTVRLTLENIYLNGPSYASASEAITFQTGTHSGDTAWLERWALSYITINGFCKNLHYATPGAGGTNSYGYGTVDHVWTNTHGGCVGVQVDNGAQVYHTLGFIMNFNTDGTTTSSDSVFSVANGGILDGLGMIVSGEPSGGNIAFANVASGGIFYFSGQSQSFGLSGNIGTGDFRLLPYQWRDSSIYTDTTAVGNIANYGGSGQTVDVYQTESFGGTNPGIVANKGYILSRTPNPNGLPPASPVFEMDGSVPTCFTIHESSSTGSTLADGVPVFCIDGGGNISKALGASFAGPVSATASSNTTGPLTLNVGGFTSPASIATSVSTNGVRDERVITGLADWTYGIQGSSQTNGGDFWFSKSGTMGLGINAGGIYTPAVRVTGLTSQSCVGTDSSGNLQSGTCSGSGTVTTTGTPATGSLAAFSGPTSITNATTSQVSTLLQTASGCATAGYVYSPQSNTCVASGGTPSGTAGGDLGGSYPNPTVASAQGGNIIFQNVSGNYGFLLKTATANKMYVATYQDSLILSANRNPSDGTFANSLQAAAFIYLNSAAGCSSITFFASTSNGSTTGDVTSEMNCDGTFSLGAVPALNDSSLHAVSSSWVHQVVVVGTGMYTTATSDTFSIPNLTPSHLCVFSPTNGLAAAGTVGAYTSAVSSGSITISHVATTASGGTVNIICSLPPSS